MSDPLLNQKFAYFEIRERIKPGGMAIVYQAYDTRRKQIVALKILQSNLALHTQIVQRFTREGQIARRLRHPNIVQFFDYGEFEGQFYIAMQYMEGGSLADALVESPRLPLRRTVQILQQIGSALDYAHGERIVHRDLKLGNILLDGSGNALLTDFGIARVREAGQDLTNTNEQMPGTVKYMSPEQVRGHKQLDHRSDLYSFAVIGYLLATGRYPFTGTSDIVILNQHLNMTPPSPSSLNGNLPNALNDVLLKGLSKDPDARYQSASEFASEFARAVAGFENMEVIVNMRAENPAVQVSGATMGSPDEVISSVIPRPEDQSPISANLRRVRGRNRVGFVALGILVMLGLLGGSVFLFNPFGIRATETPTATLSIESTREVVIAATEVTASPSVTITPTPTSTNTNTPTTTATPTVTPTETFTITPSLTPSATITPTPTFTDTPTSTPTPTASVTPTPTFTITVAATAASTRAAPTPNASPTPMFTQRADLLNWFSNLGPPSRYNCSDFAKAYVFLQGRIRARDAEFINLAELIDEDDDALNRIYNDVCEAEPDSIESLLDRSLYGELFNILQDLEAS